MTEQTIPTKFTYWADTRSRYAAVALLAWLGKSIPTTEAWTDEPGQVAVDLERLAYVSGAWSGGERRIVAVALSLLDGSTYPVDLRWVLDGNLGGSHLAMALQAIDHAAGVAHTARAFHG
jgi:hypothetical protein